MVADDCGGRMPCQEELTIYSAHAFLWLKLKDDVALLLLNDEPVV